MSWVRIHDGALSHPKIVGMVDTRRPFDLWVWGLSYAQLHLTDGRIPNDALPRGAAKSVQELCRRGLWEAHNDGFRIHGYLDWNESRSYVETARKVAKDRYAFMRAPELRRQIQARDGYFCRYCACRVNWLDRKGACGATYDHVDPAVGSTFENLVVACRGCNSRKRDRTPEEAGMIVLPPPSDKTEDLEVSRFDSELSGTRSRKHQAIIPSKPIEVQKDPPAAALSVPPSPRGTQHGRIFVHPWQLLELIDTLGPHASTFDLDAWVLGLSALADSKGLVLEKKDVWGWVKQQLSEEIRRRGLPVASSEPSVDDRENRLRRAVAEQEAARVRH